MRKAINPVTLLGAFFIPITLACFFWRPQNLLPLLVVASVFEAGSVFNGAAGDFVFGIAPFYFVEIFVAVRLFLSVWRRGTLLPSHDIPARGIARALLAFLAWSFTTALVMPHLFAGMPVNLPRERVGMDIVLGSLPSLRWSLSNLAQGIYLTLNVAAVLFAFEVIQTRAQVEKLAKALGWAVGIVVVAGVLQQLAQLTGWSYPYGVLNNSPYNPFDIHPLDHQIGSFVRISSTFAEPMNSGSFLAAAACGLLASYLRGRRGPGRLLALLAVVVVLFETASTTGYIALTIMLCLLLVYFNPLARRQFRRQPSFAKGWAAVTVPASCLTAVAILLVPSLSQAVFAMTVEKSEGMSFVSRVLADWDAWTLLVNTYGLGVGLGSSRPSSLIMTLLSTVGIVGTTLFAIVLYRVIKLFPGKWGPSVLQMSFWSLIGLLVAQAIGIPDINRPVLWALFIVTAAQLNAYQRATRGAELRAS
ncbi:MAG: hypothetical protein WAM04_08045 [Candidatus Sulfotelmatobacter sp.]